MKKIILLSGTPASGKDSITNELMKINPKFIHFRKHKISTGGRIDNSYFLLSKEEFDTLAKKGEFLQYHYRYERGYGVSRTELESNWKKGFIPVIHVGKYNNIIPFQNENNIEIISILFLTSLQETTKRLNLRHLNDTKEIKARLVAYEEERKELSKIIFSGEKLNFDLIIENSDISANQIAQVIAKVINIG